MRPRCGLGAASGLREARAQPMQEALLEDIENPIFQISVFDEQLVTVLVVEHHFFKISCFILYAKRTPERHRKDPLWLLCTEHVHTVYPGEYCFLLLKGL